MRTLVFDGGLWAYVDEARPAIERALLHHLPVAPAPAGLRFNDALCFALFPGGKRLRPVLTLLGAELVGGSREDVLPAAAAVEYIHTCSLIFDDLPCMDDALLRRGRDTLHRRYGESLAVLVALGLLNASYALVFEGGASAHRSRAIRAHAALVECIGTKGMVTGQTVDLSNTTSGRGDFDAVRNLKTSALIRLALCLGAILSGANSRQVAALSCYADMVGQAYQISDDVLDLSEDAAFAGSRTTRLATLALERGAQDARLRVSSLVSKAQNALKGQFGLTTPVRLLCEVADYVAHREA